MNLSKIYDALALSKRERNKVNRIIIRSKRKDISYKKLKKIGKYLPGFLFCVYHHKNTPEYPEEKKYSFNDVVEMLKCFDEFINR